MKTFQRIVPVVAVVLALGGAIYYVQSNAPVRPEPIVRKSCGCVVRYVSQLLYPLVSGVRRK